jgi:hypothetical protein
MMHISDTQKSLGIVVGLILLIGGGVAAASFFPTTTNQGYEPEQPIPFSHKIHAGKRKMQCAYCHVGIEKSRHATVPSLNVCMNCHRVVRLDSPYIQQMHKAFNEKRPIEWVRVHELPDYVYFPHKRHIAREISCETCHGNVKEMDRIKQVAPLSMGWCMECHRGETTPKTVWAKIQAEKKHPLGHVAPTNCSTCHN